MRAMPMTLHPSEAARYIETSPAIPLAKDRSEVRLYATIVTGSATASLFQPAVYLLSDEMSPLLRVGLVTGSPGLIAALFILAAVAMLPHLIALVFLPHSLEDARPRKMATGAMWAAAALWAYLATSAWHLDLGGIRYTYWAAAAGYLLVGGAYGYSLNAQQALEKLADEIAPYTR